MNFYIPDPKNICLENYEQNGADVVKQSNFAGTSTTWVKQLAIEKFW